MGRRRGARWCWSFSGGPRPNRTCAFPGIRLSSDYCVSGRGGLPVRGCRGSRRQTTRVLRASGHEPAPMRAVAGPAGEVGELADVVDLHLVRAARRARICPCRSRVTSSLRVGGRAGRRSVEDRVLLPFERDAAEPCDQWLPACAFDLAWKHVRGPCGVSIVALYLRAIFVTDERCLCRQGLEHRGLHDPAQPVQPVDVTGEQVVLDDAPVLGPEGADDGVVVSLISAVPARGFAARQVRGALGLDHRRGHAQAMTPLTDRRPRVSLRSLCCGR